MSSTPRVFTSESVTEGHPDKVCDRISDAILDAMLTQDPRARVAVETMVTTGLVHIAGEVTTEDAYVEIPHIVRSVIKDIGYNSSDIGFDGSSCGVVLSIGQQSLDISQGVDTSLESRSGGQGLDPRDSQGAGDQGMIFGYAAAETPDLMPAPIWLAHRLSHRLADVRRNGVVDGLRPDGKTQVTLKYENNIPVAIDTILISSQHDDSLTLADVTDLVTTQVINPVLNDCGLDIDYSDAKVLVNPSGRFVLGGPAADTGLTGRKIIVDTYGGMARHGGGAFSGKDPSKVDRSAAYMTRWAAKHVVATGVAQRCEIQASYAIGRAYPIGLYVHTFGTGELSDQKITSSVQEVFDFRPAGIIEDLDLLRPIYTQTTNYGHFGRPGLPWEELTRLDELNQALER